MKGTLIREKLRSGQPVFGTHIASLMNPVATAMATEMEIDFAFFCTEHMPIDRTELSMLCQFYAAKGISPIVRVPSPHGPSVSMALDGGAEGVVVPYVETVAQVREVVGALRYRPIKGVLLEQWLEEGVPLPQETLRFVERFNQSRYLIIGIESRPAIEALDELLDVPGVDGVFLGPHDITASLGLPEQYSHPHYLETVESIIRRCRARGVGVGLHTHLLKLEEATLQRFLAAGMNFLINGADITILRDAMNAQMRALRSLTETGFEPSSTAGEARVESCIT